jgi:hypothetical protein
LKSIFVGVLIIEIILMHVKEMVQCSTKPGAALPVLLGPRDEIAALFDYGDEMILPLGAGIVLEGKPSVASLVPALIFLHGASKAGQRQVLQTETCQFPLHLLLIDMGAFGDISVILFW